MGLPPDSQIREKSKFRNLLKNSLSSLNLNNDSKGPAKIMINQNGGRELSLEVNHPINSPGKSHGRYVRIYCENVRHGSHFCTIFIKNNNTVKETVSELVETHFQRIGETGDFVLYEVYGKMLDSIKVESDKEEFFLKVYKRSLDPELVLMDVFGSATPAPGLSRRLELYKNSYEPSLQSLQNKSRISTPVVSDFRRFKTCTQTVPSGPYLLRVIGSKPTQDLLIHNLKDLMTIDEEECIWTIGFSEKDNIRLYRDDLVDTNNNEKEYFETIAHLINKPSNNQTFFEFYIKLVLRDVHIRVSMDDLIYGEERLLTDNDVIEIQSFNDKYVFAYKYDRISESTTLSNNTMNVKILQNASSMSTKNSNLYKRHNILKLSCSETNTLDIFGYSDDLEQESSSEVKMTNTDTHVEYYKPPFPMICQVDWVLNVGVFIENFDKQSFKEFYFQPTQLPPQISSCLYSSIVTGITSSLGDLSVLNLHKENLSCIDQLESNFLQNLLDSIIKHTLSYLKDKKNKSPTLKEMIWLSVFCYNTSLYLTPGWLSSCQSISSYHNSSKQTYSPMPSGKNRLETLTEDNRSELSDSFVEDSERNVVQVKDSMAKHSDEYLSMAIDHSLEILRPNLNFFLFNKNTELSDSMDSPEYTTATEDVDIWQINLCASLDKIYTAVHANKELTSKKLHSNAESISNLDKNSGPTDSGVAIDNQANRLNPLRDYECSDSEESIQLNGKDTALRKMSPSFTSSSSNISSQAKLLTNSTAKVENVFWKRLFANIFYQVIDAIIKNERVVFDNTQGQKLKYSTNWLKMWVNTHRLEKHAKILSTLSDIATILTTPYRHLKAHGWNNLRKAFPDIHSSLLYLILKEFDDPYRDNFEQDFEIDSLDKTSSEEDPANSAKLRLDSITNKERLFPASQSYRKMKDSSSNNIFNILANYPIDDPATILDTCEAKMTIDYLDKKYASHDPPITFRWKEFLQTHKPQKILQSAKNNLINFLPTPSSPFTPGTPKSSRTPVTRSNRIGLVDQNWRSLQRQPSKSNRKGNPLENSLTSLRNLDNDLIDMDFEKIEARIAEEPAIGLLPPKMSREDITHSKLLRQLSRESSMNNLKVPQRCTTMEDIANVTGNTSFSPLTKNQRYHSTNSLGTKNNLDDYSLSDLESVSAITSEHTNLTRNRSKKLSSSVNRVSSPSPRSKSHSNYNVDSSLTRGFPANDIQISTLRNKNHNPLSRSTNALTMPKAIMKRMNNDESSLLYESEFDNRSNFGSVMNGRNSALSMSLSCLKYYNIKSDNLYSRLNSVQEMTRRNLEVVDLTKDEKNSFGFVFIDASTTKLDKFGMFIKSVKQGSPADKSGKFKFGDQIIKINDKKVREFVFSDALEYIRNVKSATFLIFHDSLDDPSPLLEKKEDAA